MKTGWSNEGETDVPDSSGRRLALVTGASGGIGEAFAREIAADGYALVLVARNADKLDRVKDDLGAKTPAGIWTVPTDLAKPDVGARLHDELKALSLSPDVVVNNAGFGLMGAATALDRNEQLGMIDLNVRAMTDLALTFLPEIVARGSGGLINVSSLSAYMPGPNMAVYYATKSYIQSLSEALHAELDDKGVVVTAVCPGPVPTGFQERAGFGGHDPFRPMPKTSAQEVARAGWRGFKKRRRVVHPGLAAFASAQLTRHAPRAILLPVIRAMQTKGGD